MAACSVALAQAGPTQSFESGVKQTTLLELYTAEGCSSCPPADAWLGRFTDNDALWHRIVPVAFHVTYWDQYGWVDPYARTEYTRRQRDYASRRSNGVAYTPNFIRNGHDWRLWFRHPRPSPIEPLDVEADAGVLRVTLDGDAVGALFAPPATIDGALDLHIAVLAFGLSKVISAGENTGRRLRHDFVVIGENTTPLVDADSGYTATAILPATMTVDASRYAFAAWVESRANMQTYQATGGWLAAAP
ncbi:DUF1223 domain-containing protein [Salinisphaera aquimarina]